MVSQGRRFGRLAALAVLAVSVVGACDDSEDTLEPSAGAGSGAGSGAAAGSGATGGSVGATSGSAGDVGGSNPGDGGSGEGGAPQGGRGGVAAAGGTNVSGDAGVAGQAGSGDGPEPELLPSCAAATGKLPQLRLRSITSVSDPVQIVSPPGDPRLFVVSRVGEIRVYRIGMPISSVFLSIKVDHGYAEKGLLGLAFHPNYAENGLFYVHYIEPPAGEEQGDLVIAEYERSSNPDVAKSEPRRVLLRVPQPTHKHKAGSMAFDSDGLLYLALGNGGDVKASGDNTQLKGKILRIDPAPDQDSYQIPPNNPQKDGWQPEILETGLRNPWRMAIDPCTDDIYIGDVGNNTAEEINISAAGEHGNDFGFPKLEGDAFQCDEEDEDCSAEGTTPPVTMYGHDEGCAMIGGVVYRGSLIPALRGTYLYSDLCKGFFRSFRYENGEISDERDLTDDLNPDGITSITSFGYDANGEVYVLSRGTNRVYRIEAE